MVGLSVIIPTLNEEACLRRTLEGLREQTFDDFEIVLVDGGSTDATRDIAREYASRVFTLKKSGLSLAKNYGAEKARASRIAFTDGDSTVPKDWLEKINQDFDQKSAEMVWGPVRFSDDASGAVSVILKIHGCMWKLHEFIWRQVPFVIAPNVAFIKKSFERIGGFRPDMRYIEDYDIGVRSVRDLDCFFDPTNTVFFSARRYGTLKDLGFDVAKLVRGLVSYHMTNTVDDVHVPVSNLRM